MLDQLFSNLPLILFLVAVLVYWVGAFIILYHLIRFGVGNLPKVTAFVFFAGSAVLMLFAFVYYLNLTR